MRTRPVVVRFVVVSALLGIIAAAATATIGFVLSWAYWPQRTLIEGAHLPPAVSASDTWAMWHQVAAAVFVIGSIAALGSATSLRDTPLRRRVVVLVGSITALVAACTTLFTQRLVAWDQLAINAVTIGSNQHGYWDAAFGHDVEFVLSNGMELSQRAYAAALIVHLAAPVVGILALAVVCVAVLKPTTSRPEPETTPEQMSIST